MFQSRLAEDAALVSAYLNETLTANDTLSQAMRYALHGGKGLRGFLVIESARLHGLDPTHVMPAAAAIEALHGYSLVHDDLPAMDDDDLRRGRPTLHVKWNEATAVLAGDALQTLAFELLSDPILGAGRIQLITTMAQAAGRKGMVLGQMRDIAAETAATPLTLNEITTLQAGKTGALIRWSAEAGAVLAGDDPCHLTAYASAIGLAFQIADDVLDIEGDTASTGKRVGKDNAAGKATFVSLMGLDGAKAKAAILVDQACDALTPYGDAADTLRQAAQFVISRKV